MKKLSSRELNQDVGRAKRAAEDGPVIITDRGRPSYVLLSIADYQRLTSAQAGIVDLLGQPAGIEGIELSPTKSRDLARAIEL